VSIYGVRRRYFSTLILLPNEEHIAMMAVILKVDATLFTLDDERLGGHAVI
jgi:hypothetical protein